MVAGPPNAGKSSLVNLLSRWEVGRGKAYCLGGVRNWGTSCGEGARKDQSSVQLGAGAWGRGSLIFTDHTFL